MRAGDGAVAVVGHVHVTRGVGCVVLRMCHAGDHMRECLAIPQSMRATFQRHRRMPVAIRALRTTGRLGLCVLGRLLGDGLPLGRLL